MKIIFFALTLAACKEPSPPAPTPAAPTARAPKPWEVDNPLKPLPKPPLGVQADYAKLKFKVTPEKVRLGRWLFFDKRVSSDATVACATCHRPENAYSEPTAHSTGVGGKEGARKAPTFINGAWPLFEVFFWDGRANSLIEQAKGPIQNPIEMAHTHEKCVEGISQIAGYRQPFADAFGSDAVNIDRVAEAIAAFEATCMSGNSKYDRSEAGDANAMSADAKAGQKLFFEKAACNQCHFGWNLTDSQFHNLGIGWDAKKKTLADPGRAAISKKKEETGACKTPTVRDLSKHAPYMHDGSLATLKDVVEHYDKGGNANPWLDPKMKKLHLSAAESTQLVAFLQALDGDIQCEGAPKTFPQ